MPLIYKKNLWRKNFCISADSAVSIGLTHWGIIIYWCVLYFYFHPPVTEFRNFFQYFFAVFVENNFIYEIFILLDILKHEIIRLCKIWLNKNNLTLIEVIQL